jgi:hypothetical protein
MIPLMAQVLPFYCLQELVYHTNDKCPQAQRIPSLEQRVGRGGKTDCLCCRHLNKVQVKTSRNLGLTRPLVS